MKDELYFHVREDNKDTLAHSYCIKKTPDDRLLVGFSITHLNDNFCRKTGRDSSKRKTDALNTIDIKYFKPFEIKEYLPRSICSSFDSVIAKSAEMFQLSSPVKVCTFIEAKVQSTRPVSNGVTMSFMKNTKIPAISEYNI
ncbi:MAG: hypothetical protein M0R17_04945 [Candidatus Omnitrophica bacterium]|jgi:hypothetical protein|nr:hypothetical protein [Candidatus Omnitrophota bacterium]